MKKIIWLSRHLLDPEAEVELREMFGKISLEKREILWSDDPKQVSEVLQRLISEFDIISGVFPAQVFEVLIDWALKGGGPLPRVLSPVNVPVQGKEGKIRKFRFARWANLGS